MLQSRVTQYFKSEQLRLPFSSTTVPSYAQDIWAQPQLVQHASLRTAVDALANAWKRLLPHAEDALSKLYTAPLEPLNIAARDDIEGESEDAAAGVRVAFQFRAGRDSEHVDQRQFAAICQRGREQDSVWIVHYTTSSQGHSTSAQGSLSATPDCQLAAAALRLPREKHVVNLAFL